MITFAICKGDIGVNLLNMSTMKYLKFIFIFIVFFFCNSCEYLNSYFDNDITIINAPAHLKITNLDTGETAEDDSTITIDGNNNNYDLTISWGQTLEVEFIPDETDGDYVVDFEVLDIKKTISQSPYKFQITIARDVPKGIYPIKCSAMNSDWDEGSSCRQAMSIRIE